MTKGITKRIEALEKQVKFLIKNEEENRKMIGNLIKRTQNLRDHSLHLDMAHVVLSNILIKKKLTTNKKMSKLYNDEVKKFKEQKEKEIQEKMNKMKNSKETLKKEIKKEKNLKKSSEEKTKKEETKK